MSRLPLTALLALATLFGTAESLCAQARVADCSGDGCPLRIDGAGYFLRPHIVRGIPAEDLGHMSASPEFADLFATHDSAAFYFRRFLDQDRVTRRLTLLAAVGMAVGGIAHVLREDSGGWPLVALGIGVSLHAGSRISLRRSRASFAEAIDWYNGGRPRGAWWTDDGGSS